MMKKKKKKRSGKRMRDRTITHWEGKSKITADWIS